MRRLIGVEQGKWIWMVLIIVALIGRFWITNNH